MEQEQQKQNVAETTAGNGKFLPHNSILVWLFLYFVNKELDFLADLQAQVEQLEMEKKKIREEFDSQRAKMKELFLQKEGRYEGTVYSILEACVFIIPFRIVLIYFVSQISYFLLTRIFFSSHGNLIQLLKLHYTLKLL